MSHTRIRIRKATSLLREDHRTIKRLFVECDRLDESDSADLAQVFEELARQLLVHSQIEEEIFYPAVERSHDEEAEERVREAREEHRLVHLLLEELSGMTADDEQFFAKLKVLKDNVLHHAEEEEREIFPIFEDLEKEEQDRIAEDLYSRRNDLMMGEEG